MALIGTLRDKMTKWIVGLVAVAIIAFVMGDLFGGGGTSGFESDSDIVGTMAGKDIDLKAFRIAVQGQERAYLVTYGRRPTESEQTYIRQQAWNRFIEAYVYEEQYEDLGLRVSEEEIWDLVQGKYVHSAIKSSFTDSLGNFDRPSLMNYLRSLEEQPAGSEARIRWDTFMADMKRSRMLTKFNNLFMKTAYVTQAEMERQYHMTNDSVVATYLYVPLYTFPDSLAVPSQEELDTYYEENKEKYRSINTRDLRYILFPIRPSATDSSFLRKELEGLKASFALSQEDSAFAALHTDGGTIHNNYTASSLPPSLADDIDVLQAGYVAGPFEEGERYKLVKIVSVRSNEVSSARASHILIKWDSESEQDKRKAKNQAQQILDDIKDGADFADKARQYGSDGTASSGGDLGWFEEGKMVKPFQAAVFSARKEGLIPRLVATQFGYHIIKVTGIKRDNVYSTMSIAREISPGDETNNKAYRQAEMFVSSIDDAEEFIAQAQADSLEIIDAEKVATDATALNTLSNVRQVVRWLFKDADMGSLSPIFDMEEYYMVAMMSGEEEEGYRPLEQVRSEITSLVTNEKKKQLIAERLEGYRSEGSIVDIARAYGTNAKVMQSKSLSLGTNAMPSIGVDPIAIGSAFGVPMDTVSRPFLIQNGVMMVEILQQMIAPAIADYGLYKNDLKEENDASFMDKINQAVEEGAQIEDKRYLFY